MSDMVDRVAKALSIADGMHPDACSNDEAEIPMWTLYVDDARAAIEAMREPTKAMLDELDLANRGWGTTDHSREIWQSVIDIALKEKIDA